MLCRGLHVLDARKLKTILQKRSWKPIDIENIGQPFKQRTNSNKTQRLHDELNHVDVEPLVDTFWQMKAQLYEFEPPRPSTENLPKIPSFYKPKNNLGGFYLY